MLSLQTLFAWVEKASLFKASFIFCLNIIKLCEKYFLVSTRSRLVVAMLRGSFLLNDKAP